MNYLLTGGTGFIGSALLKDYFTEKDNIIILSRRDLVSTDNIRYVKDLSSLGSDTKIDCIINLAGKNISCLWTKKNKKELVDSRIKITRSLVNFVKKLKVKPKIILSASAVGFYGDQPNKILDESSPGKKSFTHDLCKKWEETILKINDSDIRICILRLGVVLGADGGVVKKLLLPFKLCLGAKFGNGKQFFPSIDIKDVVSGIAFLIRNEKSKGIYNFVSPKIITNGEFVKSLAKSLNRPAIFTIPSCMIKLFLGEMGKELLLKGNQIIPKHLQDDGYNFISL